LRRSDRKNRITPKTSNCRRIIQSCIRVNQRPSAVKKDRDPFLIIQKSSPPSFIKRAISLLTSALISVHLRLKKSEIPFSPISKKDLAQLLPIIPINASFKD
jgi:hypothetical protein